MSDRAEPPHGSGGFQPQRLKFRRLEATATGTRLLVSVRSGNEARAALAGCADIIDIKEPGRGSLGRADAGTIQSVASLIGVDAPRTPLSVALGEVLETSHERDAELPPHVTFAKLGLADLRNDPNWVAHWLKARRSFATRSCSPPGWIAVIYADADAAQAPPALDVIHAAASTGCVGVLVDTYGKTGGRLLDHVTPVELALWAAIARSRRLLFAVAGGLSLEDLPPLASVSADVIAVRSAVCQGRDRCAAICAGAVTRFKRAVHEMTGDVRPPAATAAIAAYFPGD